MSFRTVDEVPDEHQVWFDEVVTPWYQTSITIQLSELMPESVQFALIEMWVSGEFTHGGVEEDFAWWQDQSLQKTKNTRKRDQLSQVTGYLDEYGDYVHPVDELREVATCNPDLGWEVADIVFRMPIKYQDLTKMMSIRYMNWAQAGRELGCDEETVKSRWRVASEYAAEIYWSITEGLRQSGF